MAYASLWTNDYYYCRHAKRAHQVVTAGDVVFFEAGERHWHGAAEDTAMSHYAIQESKEGSPVTWEEKVSDHDYQS
ncbi:hypothetical protein [Proteus mirabilis]|uniref:hypothetical protein n=1 Tax=Proteus mirabilis TaxID=584 RepID=UPI0029C02DD8|nr:hypothetical protein [Proteus mirabilis]MDX4950822.1 hypothetical protein [Proteus mirabilis]